MQETEGLRGAAKARRPAPFYLISPTGIRRASLDSSASSSFTCVFLFLCFSLCCSSAWFPLSLSLSRSLSLLDTRDPQEFNPTSHSKCPRLILSGDFLDYFKTLHTPSTGQRSRDPGLWSEDQNTNYDNDPPARTNQLHQNNNRSSSPTGSAHPPSQSGRIQGNWIKWHKRHKGHKWFKVVGEGPWTFSPEMAPFTGSNLASPAGKRKR